MKYEDFLTRIIEEGIESAKEDYAGTTPAKTIKREGAVQGFLTCKDCTPEQLVELYQAAGEKVNNAYREQAKDYWHWRCYQAEIEWVCNVVSAMLANEGSKPLLPHLPTGNGVRKASSILASES